MPLDTNDLSVGPPQIRLADDLAPLRPTRIVLNSAGPVGAALREAREGLGLAVDDIASATRVRAVYLSAIEAFELDKLPAWPFAVGYVRAYARALGLNADAVVARFKIEAPSPDRALRDPGGVRRTPRRLGPVGVTALVAATAILTWNVARHQEARPRASTATAARPAAATRLPSGPAQLGAPLPPPPEATNPPPYQTPGLTQSGSPLNPEAAAIEAPFVAAGAVYGAAASPGGIVLQARKGTTMIIRSASGGVYFARQLAAGEAWRAPATAGLTLDVGNPDSVAVFVGGLSRGVLPQAQMPLSQVGG